MPDIDVNALRAARDLGLSEHRVDAADVKGRAALEREFERERGRNAPPVRRRRWRPVVALSSVLAVVGLGAVGYAALTTSSTASEGIGCHADNQLGGSVTATHLDGRRATETCSDLWASGDVGAGTRDAPAPLHSCVAGDGGGAIHVFASADDDICASVGLEEDPQAGADPAARRFGAFAEQLDGQLNRAAFACPTREQVVQLVEGLLRANRMTGWTVGNIDGYDRGAPCVSVALDSDARSVTLVAESP